MNTFANVYNFSFDNIDILKPEIRLEDYKDKVILIVNTASKCGFADQFNGLQDIYDKYKDKGLVVIAVPSNDFGEQELKTKGETESFCRVKFGVKFPVTATYNVKGEKKHPFFKYAEEKINFKPRWNFYKVLINKKGEPVESYSSFTKPTSGRFIKKIETLLAE